MPKTTYTRGFFFRVDHELTRKAYVQLCNLISEKLNRLYGNTDDSQKIQIKPEPIIEGGMIFDGGNFEKTGTDKKYKSMRHHVFLDDRPVKWPWIKDSTSQEWSTSDEVLWPKEAECCTFLKASHLVWTLDELKIFKECFEDFDLRVTQMPAKYKLTQKARRYM